MLTKLDFQPLTSPLAVKTLRHFRRDAGWDIDGAAAYGENAFRGRVQWVTASLKNKVIGIARLELAPPQFCYLSDLIVLRAYYGRGVGAWLMDHIEYHCRALAIPRVILRPLEDNRRFYEKRHFVADPLVAGFLKKEIGPSRRLLLPF